MLLLAALAAGAGWWFGSGPGSLVAVPNVANLTFERGPAAILAEEALQAVQVDVFDIEIAPGVVVGTDPPAGSRVDKDATVDVLVSKGPQDHAGAGTRRAVGGRGPRHPARAEHRRGRARRASTSRMPRGNA